MLSTHNRFRIPSNQTMVIFWIFVILVTIRLVCIDIVTEEGLHHIKRQVGGKFTMNFNVFLIQEALQNSTDSNNYSTLPTSSTTPSSIISSYCPQESPHLEGRKNVSKVPPVSMEELESAFKKKDNMPLEPGGIYKPPRCLANHRVAIIIPFRNREEHLLLFLQHMHPFLQRQQIEYGIFVVEQSGVEPFNRATLMNIGVVEAIKQTFPPYSCFIFHDVDLLPEDDHNTYSCLDDNPKHMSVAIDTLNYTLPYITIFGGVCAMTKEHFFLVNGFSNSFWGWGGEDDDLYRRVKHHKLKVLRPSPEIARYTMSPHKKAKKNVENGKLVRNGKRRYSTDGLNSLHYKLLDLQLKPLYIHIVVHLLYSPKFSY